MARYTIDNRPAAINFECNDDILMRTLQNCKNLLMCQMGEVPYDRMRGLNPAIFDLPMDKANEEITQEMDRVMGWEPDAEVVSASMSLDENGDTIIEVVLEINV